MAPFDSEDVPLEWSACPHLQVCPLQQQCAGHLFWKNLLEDTKHELFAKDNCNKAAKKIINIFLTISLNP
jgi:hypothetical protein